MKSTSYAGRPRRARPGFTLIELLVSISVIGLLIALLMPAVQQARETARRASCLNNLKQLGVALHNYHSAHKVLPPGSIYSLDPSNVYSGWGWGAMLLPFIDQAPIYEQIDFETINTEGRNGDLVQVPLSIWLCPSDTAPRTAEHQAALTSGQAVMASGNYASNIELMGGLDSLRFADVTDGLSNTVMAGEVLHVQPAIPGAPTFTSSWVGVLTLPGEALLSTVPYRGISGTPTGGGSHAGSLSSRHNSGVNVLLADGSVRFVSENIDERVFSAMGTPAGGEVP